MRIIVVISMVWGWALNASSQSCENKTALVATLSAVTAKPQVFQSDNYLYIIHPMIKKEDRERECKVVGNLKWEGDSCQIVYISYEQTKGPKSKSTIELGKSYRFAYPIHTLKTFLDKHEFEGWEYAENLKLDEEQFKGYKSTVKVDGVDKDFQIYLKDNQLYAASCGFAKAGISHATEMNESADFWYFSNNNEKLKLAKKYTIEASKNNGVPILNKITATYIY